MENYILPFSKHVKFKMVKPEAHEKFPETKHATDFIVDIETPVLASRGGTVIKVKSDSDTYLHYPNDIKNLEDSEIRRLAEEHTNYVCIDHHDGTYAEYLHLGKDKILVKEGQKIRQGKLIGYTGLSGIMSRPHLHVNVFDKNSRGISVNFR
jgi:murein DD-endopeptidase MepM/ murein hydrolase activator NlpD